ncbi:MAG TPA: TonB-dependent receptor [Steroidobacter sp.]|uniref:TonB-dependent receptor plug domain-containing protein n=1 Tax=Steroidobacter sp. TaxID=1978227 RepID=UPI002ED93DE7
MRMRRGTSQKVALLGCVNMAVMAVSPAGAQDAASGLEEVVVTATGTRISGFDAPTPLTEVSRDDLEAKAVQRVSDLLVDVPAFSANQNIGRTSASIGASNFDLRGLGTARTLLLLDGRRVAPTDPAGTIDTNIIPASLIKSIEIVTGGASAAYGSDAVSGVVNIFLDDEFEGLKGDFQYGMSSYEDVETAAASLTGGHAFMGGRLHVVGSLDYYDNRGQLRQASRPWGRNDYALITNPNGPPSQVRARDTRYSQLTNGGVATLNNIPALRGIQFGPGGTVLPFNYGTSVGSTFMIGGDGGSMADNANILPEIGRKSAFTRATFDINDSVSIYADALYSKTDAFSDSAYAVNRTPIAIGIDNAFLPQDVRDIMTANGASTFFMGRIVEEAGTTNTSIDNTVERYGFGLEGRFGDGWRWDTAVQFSRNDFHREDGNNQHLRRYAFGVDSVINPATNQPICRALLNAPNSTDPDIANCVPINIFGVGSISPQALDYFRGTAVLDSQQEQRLFGFNLSGSLFQTWAGDVAVAFGGEYREDEIKASSDPISQSNGWFAVNAKPLSGKVDVKEVYAEAVVPLLNDSPFGYAMDVNGAVRVTDYSTSGRVNTWKLGVNYSPIDQLRLRATVSRDIRAPSINELFSGQNQSVNILFDPRPDRLANVTAPLRTGGNPDLDPEISDALTVGLVYQPHWADGLRMSVDYYSFEIEDAIATLTGQQILDGCFNLGQQQLCNAITLDGTGAISLVQATLINAAAVKTSGFDIELGYSLPLGADKLDLRLLGTYVDELVTTINNVSTDVLHQLGSEASGGIPQWRFVTSARYVRPTFSAGVLVRYIDSGLYRSNFVSGVNIDDNSIPSRTYVDVDYSKTLNDHFEVYAKVNNVFDVDPPLAPSQITEPNYNSGAFHDRIGRYFKLGARVQF